MKQLIEEIALPNRLILNIWNASRVIAADTTSVILIASIKMALKPEHFQEAEHYKLTTAVFGQEMLYEYRVERTFVKTDVCEAAYQELLESFKANTLPYLSHAAFPEQFSRSKHREIMNNPYRYRDYLEKDI